MAEKPILFSGPMVRAILDGRKTQTRRVVKPKHEGGVITSLNPDGLPIESWGGGKGFAAVGMEVRESPYGKPGDQLWVRETFATSGEKDSGGSPTRRVAYQADGWAGYVYAPQPPHRHGHILKSECPTSDEIGECFGLGRYGGKWRPSIHLPRWASRIQLEVTGVRVERLQDITPDDAWAEGIWHASEEFRRQVCQMRDSAESLRQLRLETFQELWNSINGKPRDDGEDISWSANPWVWVVEFKQLAECGV